MTQPIGELTDRMREIFGVVVEAYLERGHPVGSKALTGTIHLSPASIRGVMQELEERGLLTHPHTSAGRIPTESGLRLFVDGIMQTAAPDPRERREIERQIARDQPIEDALAAASAALSGLSQAVPALSFEFTTIQRDVALACIERCAALGYARFNAALGESQALIGDWMSAQEVARWLTALPQAANSGDIYAVAA